jgi:exosortase
VTDLRVADPTPAADVKIWPEWRSVLYILPLPILVAFLYAGVIRDLATQWWQEPEYSHGFAVPIFAAFLIYRDSGRIFRVRPESSNSGFLLILAAVLLLLAGRIALELYLTRVSLVVLLCGLVAFLFGWRMLRVLAFPLSYLLLMIPLPSIVYNQITFPLQLLASRLASAGLQLASLPVLREGTLLSVPGYSMDVAEACSGVRSLHALLALFLAFLFVAEDRWRVRSALLILVFPVAILSNAFRVFGAGLLGSRLGPVWADGFLHTFSGWLIFLCGLISLLGMHRFLNWKWSRRLIGPPGTV